MGQAEVAQQTGAEMPAQEEQRTVAGNHPDEGHRQRDRILDQPAMRKKTAGQQHRILGHGQAQAAQDQHDQQPQVGEVLDVCRDETYQNLALGPIVALLAARRGSAPPGFPPCTCGPRRPPRRRKSRSARRECRGSSRADCYGHEAGRIHNSNEVGPAIQDARAQPRRRRVPGPCTGRDPASRLVDNRAGTPASRWLRAALAPK